MTTPLPELTDRMRQIFGLVVDAYIERGVPVGSKMLAGNVSLSPASIRGVMQELEERGLLTHPHTSAGRVPTETGLRLFVDGIMQATLPAAAERAAIESLMDRSGSLEETLSKAT
ncbi:MAG: heat-inducible transcriptional repressor HrcA, partial [Sphingomicrobium sp.]